MQNSRKSFLKTIQQCNRFIKISPLEVFKRKAGEVPVRDALQTGLTIWAEELGLYDLLTVFQPYNYLPLLLSIVSLEARLQTNISWMKEKSLSTKQCILLHCDCPNRYDFQPSFLTLTFMPVLKAQITQLTWSLTGAISSAKKSSMATEIEDNRI